MTNYDSSQATSEIQELRRTVDNLRLDLAKENNAKNILRHTLLALVTESADGKPFDYNLAYSALAEARETDKTFITER